MCIYKYTQYTYYNILSVVSVVGSVYMHVVVMCVWEELNPKAIYYVGNTNTITHYRKRVQPFPNPLPDVVKTAQKYMHDIIVIVLTFSPTWSLPPSSPFSLFLCVQYLNVKLNDISVPDPDKYPHMVHTRARARTHTHTHTPVLIFCCANTCVFSFSVIC